ncbi:MAG: MBL fold metallo-hydrolase [Syntrophomonadaceae bacterium]|nr:MBL fold metallo-hydrolase [Syntrophomonadaceae bacterium]
MRLKQITDRSYYIDFPSLVGVYRLNDSDCLLIDSGASKAFGKRAMKILAERGLKVHSIINTHFHGDHSGGNQAIQKASNCDIYASKLEKVFLENPILSPYGIYSAYPIAPLKNKFLMCEPSLVTEVIEGDTITIMDEEFKIINLAGHTLGQIGVITPDGVLFVGDAIISDKNIEKFPFLYIANLAYHLETLEKLRETNYPAVVLSHGGLIKDWRGAISLNEEQIKVIINIILGFVKEAKSREEICDEVIKKLDLPINTSQYFLISASVSAYLTYLCEENLISSIVAEHKVSFVSK